MAKKSTTTTIEVTTEVSSLPKLKFKESLSKNTTNLELLKKLKLLHSELSSIDQDLIQIDSLNNISKELIKTNLLLNKEKGVKAFLACCLVDILRLYAPEAPYTQNELKDLFQFIFRQLRHLTSPAELHFEQYFYLIESLSNVKSIVIICDLDSSDELMTDIFKQSFDVISSTTPKNVEICMADILMQLLEETSSIPSDVVDSLLAQFLPKNVKHKPTAHRLAVDVCTGSTDKLQRYVCQYFAEVITSTLSGNVDSDDEMEEEETIKGGKKLNNSNLVKALPAQFVTAHDLIRQINKSVPGLLLNVIPQLEEELTTEQSEYRKLATEVLGEMIGEPLGSGDLAAKYPGTWKEWLRRHNDRVPAVRIAMVEKLRTIWTQHPELGNDIELALAKLLIDTDDKVRIAACTVFEEMDYETASHHVSQKTLRMFGERCKDKKANVRAIAFQSLGRLYDLAFSEIEQRDPHAISQFAWIPGTILDAATIGDSTLLTLIQGSVAETIHRYILPSPKKEEEESQWVERLLVVTSHLLPGGLMALKALSRLEFKRPSLFHVFIACCEKNNGGIIDENEELIKSNLKNMIRTVAGRLPCPTNSQNKVSEDLEKFAKANEKQLYKLLRTLMDVQTDLKTHLKAYKDCLKRLESISPTIVETFISIIHSSSLQIFNKSSIPTLLKKLSSSSSTKSIIGSELEIQAQASFIWLDYACRKCPSIYKSHVAELTKVLNAGSGKEGGDERAIEIALHALSKMSKAEPETAPEKKVSEKAKEFARIGTSAIQAKYAATILALDESRPGAADDLVEFLADALLDASESELVAHFSALARLAKFAPRSMENKSVEITTFAVETLTRGTVPGEQPEDEETEWMSEEETHDLTKARILAVKLLTNKCLAFADSPEAIAVAAPVFTMLWQLLQQRNAETRYSRPTESRLRLAAAFAVLKLGTKSAFQNKTSKNFNCLARTAQDSCFDVRSAFIKRLINYLRNDKIPTAPRYNMILFLVAHDPEDEIKNEIQYYVAGKVRRLSEAQRQALFEHPFVRLIHLVAHHVDFEGDATDDVELKSVAKYIEWYLQCLATQDNVPYLFHLALKIKTIRDCESEGSGKITDADRKLYMLSDLTQHLIKCLAREKGWAIPTHPHTVQLPGDIFRKLPDAQVANQISKKMYISAEVLAKVASSSTKISKTVKPRAEVKPKVEKDPNATPKKRKSPKASTSKGTKRLKKAKAADWNSDSDEDDEEDDELSTTEEDEDEEDEKTPKGKKATTSSVPKKVTESKRAGLRGSNGNSNGKSTIKEPETRAAVKGLSQPRAIKKGKTEEVISDLDDDDSEDEMDQD